MSDNISRKAAIEAVRNIPPEWARKGDDALFNAVTIKQIIEALSALPAVEDSLQQCMNELNATKDALAQAEAEIALLESRGDRDWNDRSECD